GQNYTGLCPFHNEKTPSFSVSRQKQIYKCFGCGEGGNVFTFLMKTQKLTFDEAVRELAKRAGITIPEVSESDENIRIKRDTLENINRIAARFFYENLKMNNSAAEYLVKRGIEPQTMVKFGIGYSLDSWDSLYKHLISKGFSDEDIKESGLMSGSDKNKCYDRFRNRLMFPVFDYRGRVIGFGARVLDDSKPKYLNSPDTLLFKKGTNLYGLNLFSKSKKQTDDSLIVVEGYMDCIALHQAGITNAVAALGTAFTTSQARLMKRYVKKVYICFDSDAAGRMATLKGMEVLINEGFEVKFLMVPDGKDPDEFIRLHGSEDFKKLLDKALNLTDFKILNAKEGLNLKVEEDKIKFFKRVVPILKNMSEIEKDIYVQRLADETSIRSDSIMAMVKGKEIRKPSMISRTPIEFVESGQIKAERYLLNLLSKGNMTVVKELDGEELATAIHRKIYDLLVGYEGDWKDISSHIQYNLTEADELSEWVIIDSIDSLPPDIPENKLIEDYSATVKYFNLRNRQKLLLREINELERKGRMQESLELAKELIELQKLLGGK
ncbi:MAG: DNA primase, partial [Clostridiaceae bacterium]